MTDRLEGIHALITGAASGIGAASARRLAREGARLLLADVNGEGAKKCPSAVSPYSSDSLSSLASRTSSWITDTDGDGTVIAEEFRKPAGQPQIPFATLPFVKSRKPRLPKAFARSVVTAPVALKKIISFNDLVDF
jgi:NAD(P)-dependent dehydrogenase (short-subunit alcohol dehydrogenase family)